MHVSVVVSTFERPAHLERCLASLDAQRGVDGLFEVVVADDGSGDETRTVAATAARRGRFPLRFVTHRHEGFRLSRCRNEGVAASTSPYLLFIDGDCILPPDHLRTHLAMRRPGRVVAGDCIRLDEASSRRVTAAGLRAGLVPTFSATRERTRLLLKGLRAKVYERCRVSLRPRLSGNNIAVWRSDYERVNGFDEAYVGWGLEDHDFQVRLERCGLRCWSILLRTTAWHLWHPPATSFARNGIGTSNLEYFKSLPERPTWCHNGLLKAGSATCRGVERGGDHVPARAA